MDRILLQQLLSEHPWHNRVICLDTVDSTNTYLKNLALRGAAEGTAVLARQQTNGRGRCGRLFDSQPGGLYLSVLLRPEVLPQNLTVATPMTAAAVKRALQGLDDIPVKIKWVNDILLHQKKLCGILCELVPTGGRPALVVGLGLNVSQKKFSGELDRIAISLAQAGYTVSIESLASSILRQMLAVSRDLASGNTVSWINEYAADCITVGRQITIPSAANGATARAYGIGAAGELLIVWPDGTKDAVNAGEVLTVEPQKATI